MNKTLHILGEIFKEIANVLSESFGRFLDNCSEFLLGAFRLFWLEENDAIGVLRVEHIKFRQLFTEISLWLVLSLANLYCVIFVTNVIGLLGIFLTIFTLTIFLYWIRLAITYRSKRHVVNPDQEI